MDFYSELRDYYFRDTFETYYSLIGFPGFSSFSKEFLTLVLSDKHCEAFICFNLFLNRLGFLPIGFFDFIKSLQIRKDVEISIIVTNFTAQQYTPHYSIDFRVLLSHLPELFSAILDDARKCLLSGGDIRGFFAQYNSIRKINYLFKISLSDFCNALNPLVRYCPLMDEFTTDIFEFNYPVLSKPELLDLMQYSSCRITGHPVLYYDKTVLGYARYEIYYESHVILNKMKFSDHMDDNAILCLCYASRKHFKCDLSQYGDGDMDYLAPESVRSLDPRFSTKSDFNFWSDEIYEDTLLGCLPGEIMNMIVEAIVQFENYLPSRIPKTLYRMKVNPICFYDCGSEKYNPYVNYFHYLHKIMCRYRIDDDDYDAIYPPRIYGLLEDYQVAMLNHLTERNLEEMDCPDVLITGEMVKSWEFNVVMNLI